MRLVTFLIVATAVIASGVAGEQHQQHQRILRRVIKSTPTATNLGRIRLVTVRSTSSAAEKGAVSEISSKEAANFGQRSGTVNETTASAHQAQQQLSATKTKSATPSPQPASSSSTTTVGSSSQKPSPKAPVSTTTTTSTTTSTSAPSTSSTAAAIVSKVSERQQAAEVELLASAPSSWQMMSAVEAPAAALIAVGTRPAANSQANDLTSSSSEEDFLRSSSDSSRSQYSSGETFSRLRQQSSSVSKTRQQQPQQQSFFYPQQQQQLRQGKTSNYQQAAKTHWYQPSSSTTTQKPAPLITQQQEQQYEQYVEQQQVDSAPPGQAEPYAFDFNSQDNSGNGQYRKEQSDNNGVVRGSYGFRDASGMYRHVEYVADHNGFRANIKSNEPGLEGGRDSQPASIKLDGGGPAPSVQSQRFASSNNDNSGDWTSASSASNVNERAELALAPPEFESSHKAERIRAPRHY